MHADQAKTKQLLATARGQIDGLIKMIDDDRYCIDISNQIMAAQAILSKVNREVLHAHLNSCVLDAFNTDNLDDRQEKMDEMKMVIDKLSR